MGLIFKILLISASLFFKNAFCQEALDNKDLNISFEGFEVINNPPPSKAPEVEETEKQKTGIKNKMDNFFDRSVRSINELKSKGTKLIDGKEANPPPPQKNTIAKENPAKKFPDPLFYGAIYKSQPQFITYAYIYNDKSNRDNEYIPPLLEYSAMDQLLVLAKDRNKKDNFYEIYKVGKKSEKFNINHQDKNGNTLLLIALRNANFEIFKSLLSEGANPNICNNFNICPIQMAIYSDNLMVVEILASRNIDLYVKDKNGLDVMRGIIYYGKREALEIILKRYLLYPVSIAEQKALIDFAENLGRTQIARDLRTAFKL